MTTTYAVDLKNTPGTHKHSLWRWIGGAFVVLLIAIIVALRLYLGVWALNYVNNVLHHIKGYQGSVENIHIDLYRGAYRIDKLILNKKEGTIPTPFVAIDVTDISIEWSALLHGRIVSNIKLIHPTLNFAVKNDVAQTGEDVDWTQPIKALSPVDINHVDLQDGTVAYKDFSSTPKVDIFIHHMNGYASNLRNVENPSDPLPSTLNINGSSIGSGHLSIQGKLNILKEVPDMDLVTKLENVHLPALNTYSDAYAAVNFKDGDVDLYSQLKIKNKQVSGYVKLLARNISVDIAKTANPLQALWSTIVAGVITVFTNPSKDQFATRADLEGTLDNIDTNTWSILGSILRNAFISALKRGFDKDVMGDAYKGNQ